jgi:hypothetical protein
MAHLADCDQSREANAFSKASTTSGWDKRPRRCRRRILVGLELDFRFMEAESMGVSSSVPPVPIVSKLLQDFGRIGCRIGFVTLVESNE